MIRSMTAFARQEAVTDQGTLSWELRSVNHRYLEMAIRLPDELRAAEPAVRARINERLGRGKVDAACRFRPVVPAAAPVELDEDYLARLLAVCREVDAHLPQSAPLSPMEVLRWPGVVREEEQDVGPLIEAAMALLDETLDQLIATRETEGEKIHGLLLQRCDAAAELVARARERLPEITAALCEKLRTRLAELNVPADPGRLEQELVFLVQKIDVDEEMHRLEGHINEVRDVLQRDEPVGRRLDFLMQELNREANTLGSKSAAAETTNISVELKVLIEQMREQVQNTE
ncbi:MAG: YicC family protein [Gammaproteobacteria bacterium]|nr:MAG: YicC family protein [Gammaproteobacteria bacterium]